MMRSLEIGATGMLAQQLNVDVISNNIANMTTTGYKRQRAAFQDLIYQNIDEGMRHELEYLCHRINETRDGIVKANEP